MDFWALGVMIYYMLSCETPFAAPEDSEIKIYSKIAACQFSFPSHFSATAIDLINKVTTSPPPYTLSDVISLSEVFSH